MYILENFEIMNEVPGYIYCDKEIALVLSILWQKGYRTYASCAGHNKNMFLSEEFETSISNLSWIKSCGSAFEIVYQDEEKIKYHSRLLGDSTYIAFSENYNFEFLPEGFTVENNPCGITIQKKNSYYDEECIKRKSNQEIENNLKLNIELLMKWAQALKNISK